MLIFGLCKRLCVAEAVVMVGERLEGFFLEGQGYLMLLSPFLANVNESCLSIKDVDLVFFLVLLLATEVNNPQL